MRRIISNPRIFGGKPVIDGTRMSVEQILGLIGNGLSIEEIVRQYPQLTAEDVRGAVLHARDAMQHDVVIDVRSA